MAVDPSLSPATDELELAHCTFERKESGRLFRRVATELVDLALNDKTSITVTEDTVVLLQTWVFSIF